MKTIALLTVVSFIWLQSFAQAAYDSLTNVPVNNIKSLYGQKVIILNENNFHPKMDVFSKNEANILKKQYEVITAKRDNKNPRVWLILTSSNDSLFCPVGSGKIGFITVGYLEKQTKLYTGKKFKLNLPGEFKELNTGIINKFDEKEQFVCSGSTIIEEGKSLIPALILKSAKGVVIYTPIKDFDITSTNSIQLFTIEP